MPRPICVKCQTDFRPHNNDVVAIETMNGGEDYKAWCADLWKCPSCGEEIIIGFGKDAFAEHYQNDFKDKIKTLEEGGMLICRSYDCPKQ
jgi:hypothetical protein